MPIGYSGTVTCPSDFVRFCTLAFSCPSLCNRNGFCVADKCFCNIGYTGSDCSITTQICNDGYFLDLSS